MNLIKTATLLMATAAVLSAPAMELTYQFDTENLTAAVSGWTGNDDTANLTIPETAYCDQLGRTLPVTTIASDALNNLSALRSVTISKNIEEISGCLHNGYTVEGMTNFIGCPNLERFIVDADNRWFVTTPEGILMSYKSTVLYRVPQAAVLDHLSISPTCHVIVRNALRDNTTIKSITLPQSISIIDPEAGLTSMTALSRILNNTLIFSEAHDCLVRRDDMTLVAYPAAKETSVLEVPAGVQAVATSAIANNPFITTLRFTGQSITLDKNAVSGCSALTTVILPPTARVTTGSFGSSNGIDRIVLGTLTGDKWPFTYNGGQHTVNFFVTADSGDCPDGQLTFADFYRANYGARVSPLFYCAAVTPQDGYPVDGAEYYVPAKATVNYTQANRALDMFTLSFRDDSGFACIESHPMFDNVKMLSCTFNGSQTDTFSIAGIVTGMFPYALVTTATLNYEVDGVAMSSTYTVDQLGGQMNGITAPVGSPAHDAAPRLVIYRSATAPGGAVYLDLQGRPLPRPAEGQPCIMTQPK